MAAAAALPLFIIDSLYGLTAFVSAPLFQLHDRGGSLSAGRVMTLIRHVRWSGHRPTAGGWIGEAG
jgi:hypothetical protein